MTNLNGLKVSLCQMDVIPGRPDLNTDYIISEIKKAAKKGIDIIIFPEMAVPGYFIGDILEDESFIKDLDNCNEKIRFATKAGIIAIWGNIKINSHKKHEDGRTRKYNAAFIAQNGQWVENGFTIKSLLPNYRIFSDSRHYWSMNQEQAEINEQIDDKTYLNDFLNPFTIKTSIGSIKLGLILCEDMWHENYPHNPTKDLIRNGAELIINLSASPWTWQKNRKRHQIVKDLNCGVPFIYVNNTGIQNNGKNIIIFDGSSTIYNKNGEIIFETQPYEKGCKNFTFKKDNKTIPVKESTDIKQMYLAIKQGITEFMKGFPPQTKIFIGLSGGIDSALSAVEYVDALGKDNVVLVNMPSQYNSQQTKDIAYNIALNLGCKYLVIPIQETVDAIAKATCCEPNTLAYENIQARVRMEILAALAQKHGGVFTANWNKIEAAFGYGTLYGDINGFLAINGDLIKREIYELTDYYNKHVFKKEIIPEACFTQAPTAELRSNNQKDPFHYGTLERRGYHDEMVRAFVCFRKNPEWFLEKYLEGTLEKRLLLEKDTLKKLFPTHQAFIEDLEKNWRRFFGSYFKRVQGPPCIIVSKRAFGNDLNESMMSAHFTQRYLELKKIILSKNFKKKIAILGGSFNPTGNQHLAIVEELLKQFDEVIVMPCGPRIDKDSINQTAIKHRKQMSLLAFSQFPRVKLDLYDLENQTYTPTYKLDEFYKKNYPNDIIWHVIGPDIIVGGAENKSEIHRVWQKGNEIWENLNFAIINPDNEAINPKDLPPNNKIINVFGLTGRSTLIRNNVKEGKPISDLVLPEVEKYILENGLYKD